MMKSKIEQIKEYLSNDTKVMFAYLFGSAATGETGPLSDLDVAVYLDKRVDHFIYRPKLMEMLVKYLRYNYFDLIVLNNASPLLKYEVVKNGIILKDKPEQRVIFETQVLEEYFDTAFLRETQSRAIREKMRRGDYFG